MRLTSATTAIVAALVAGRASGESIYEIAKNNSDFSTLVAAIDAAELDAALDGPGNFTVFAPPNSAFDKLDQDAVARLLEPEWFYHLQDLLLYHALGFPFYSTDIIEGDGGAALATLNGESIFIDFTVDPPRINNASNIILDLVDIQADNGVIHAVDTVLLPTSATSNIVQIGLANPVFSTLVELVVAADLVDALSGEGPMTLFAPPNEAFDELPEGTVEDLKKPENKDTLVGILTYHVVGANVASADLVDGPVETLQGTTVEISTNPPMVNDANIVTADVLANNGIVHVIDKVLIPAANGTSSAPTPASDGTSAPTAAPVGGNETETEAPTSAPSGAGARVLSIGALAAGAAVSCLFI